jgi:hypothetical protein
MTMELQNNELLDRALAALAQSCRACALELGLHLRNQQALSPLDVRGKQRRCCCRARVGRRCSLQRGLAGVRRGTPVALARAAVERRVQSVELVAPHRAGQPGTFRLDLILLVRWVRIPTVRHRPKAAFHECLFQQGKNMNSAVAFVSSWYFIAYALGAVSLLYVLWWISTISFTRIRVPNNSIVKLVKFLVLISLLIIAGSLPIR